LAVKAQLYAQNPQLSYILWNPVVIRSDRVDPVVLQAFVTGGPTRVVFESNTNASPFQQPGSDIDMIPAGSAGAFSVTLTPAQLTAGLRADDVYRRFVGFIKIFSGSSLISRANIFAEIITPEIPRLPVTVMAPDVQRTDTFVNIVDSAFFGSTFDYFRVAKKFYQFFPDDFDFLNIVLLPGYFQNRFHFTVKNEVQGIGLARIDNAAFYGSNGRLKGITVFPNTFFFDGATAGYQHELGHQWINYLSTAPFSSGIPHWPLSSMASGIMGWSDPVTLQGLSFPCRLLAEPGGVRLTTDTGTPVFTDFDMYLMGLVPAESVGEHLVFADQNQARSLSCNGQLFTGAIVRVTAANVLSVLGRRTPEPAALPPRFRIATVLVSRDGLLSEDAMALYSFFARRAAETREVAIHEGFLKATGKPFVISTGGRAALDPTVVPVADLDLAKTHAGIFFASRPAVYILTISNIGSASTSGTITVADTLPDTLRYVTASGSGWTCSALGQSVTCTSGAPIQPGGKSTLTLTVQVSSAVATIINTATVSNVSDTNTANNTSTDTSTTVRPPRRRP
jgi:hypothetical protein